MFEELATEQKLSAAKWLSEQHYELLRQASVRTPLVDATLRQLVDCQTPDEFSDLMAASLICLAAENVRLTQVVHEAIGGRPWAKH